MACISISSERYMPIRNTPLASASKYRSRGWNILIQGTVTMIGKAVVKKLSLTSSSLLCSFFPAQNVVTYILVMAIKSVTSTVVDFN
jgi:hypothetical protein